MVLERDAALHQANLHNERREIDFAEQNARARAQLKEADERAARAEAEANRLAAGAVGIENLRREHARLLESNGRLESELKNYASIQSAAAANSASLSAALVAAQQSLTTLRADLDAKTSALESTTAERDALAARDRTQSMQLLESQAALKKLGLDHAKSKSDAEVLAIEVETLRAQSKARAHLSASNADMSSALQTLTDQKASLEKAVQSLTLSNEMHLAATAELRGDVAVLEQEYHKLVNMYEIRGQKMTELEQVVNGLHKQVQQSQEQLAASQAQVDAARREADMLRGDAAKAQAMADQARAESAAARGASASAAPDAPAPSAADTAAAQSIAEELHKALSELDTTKRDLRDAEEGLENVGRALKKMEVERFALTQELETRSALADTQAHAVEQKTQELAQLNARVIDHENKLAAAEARLAASEARGAQLDQSKLALEQHRGQLEMARATLEQDLLRRAADLESAVASQRTLQRDLDGRMDELAALRAQIATLQAALREKDAEVARLNAQLSAAALQHAHNEELLSASLLQSQAQNANMKTMHDTIAGLQQQLGAVTLKGSDRDDELDALRKSYAETSAALQYTRKQLEESLLQNVNHEAANAALTKELSGIHASKSRKETEFEHMEASLAQARERLEAAEKEREHAVARQHELEIEAAGSKARLDNEKTAVLHAQETGRLAVEALQREHALALREPAKEVEMIRLQMADLAAAHAAALKQAGALAEARAAQCDQLSAQLAQAQLATHALEKDYIARLHAMERQVEEARLELRNADLPGHVRVQQELTAQREEIARALKDSQRTVAQREGELESLSRRVQDELLPALADAAAKDAQVAQMEQSMGELTRLRQTGDEERSALIAQNQALASDLAVSKARASDVSNRCARVEKAVVRFVKSDHSAGEVDQMAALTSPSPRGHRKRFSSPPITPKSGGSGKDEEVPELLMEFDAVALLEIEAARVRALAQAHSALATRSNEDAMQMQELQEALRTAQAELEATRTELATVHSELKAADAASNTQIAQIQSLENALTASGLELDSLRTAHDDLAVRLRTADRNHTESEQAIATLQQDAAAREQEIAQMRSQGAQQEAELHTSLSNAQSLQSELEQLKSALHESRSVAESKTDELETLARRAEKQAKELAEIKSEQEALQTETVPKLKKGA